jgi:hypothetical protein
MVAGLVAFQTLLFETVGRSDAWEGFFASVASLPMTLPVCAGLALGAVAAWLGGTRVPARAAGRSAPAAA